MAASTAAGRRALFGFTAKVFSDTAAKMHKKTDGADRYGALGRGLSGLGDKLRRLDRDADDRISQMIADGAKAVAAALPSLSGRRAGKVPPRAAASLAGGLDRLSDGLKLAAGSLSLAQAPARGAGTQKALHPAERRKLNVLLRTIHDETVALAEEYFLAAAAVRESAGLATPPERRQLFRPILSESACGGCGAGRTEIREPRLPGEKLPSPATLKPNPQRLLLTAAGLGETALGTANLLNAYAALFGVIVVIGVGIAIACSDECKPAGVVRVSPYIIASRKVGNQYYPSLGFLWVVCCRCDCFLWIKQQREVTTQVWGQVLVLDPKATDSEAKQVARTRADELARDYNAALSAGTKFTTPSDISPAFVPPDCSC